MSSFAEWVALRDAARRAASERPQVPLALATLVAVNGSSYRQAGARMLCDADGRVLAGAISGGCLEADVAQRVASVCASGGSTLTAYDLREDLETIWGFGTGCDGVAHVLLSPVDLAISAAIDAALSAATARVSGVLETVVVSSDVSRIGRTTFIRSDEIIAHQAIARTVLHTNAPLLATQHNEQVFGAPVQPPPQVVVIGASRGAEAFAEVAVAAGWRVTIVDHRSEALHALELPVQTTRIAMQPDNAPALLTSQRGFNDSRTCIALCTHRFEHDLTWLAAALRTSVPYVGLLGSRQRAARLLRALGDTGHRLRARDRARIYAPIGLDVGGDSPQSIALAAIAEMHAVLHARPAGSLRERQTPLHTRTSTPELGADVAAVACVLPSRTMRSPRRNAS